MCPILENQEDLRGHREDFLYKKKKVPQQSPTSSFSFPLPPLIHSKMSSDSEDCTAVNNPDTYLHLRVASVFIVLACATAGTLFPVLARRSQWLHVPKFVFDFAKYFGSGVIIATAFIHLLSPGLDELSSPCLSPAWSEYVHPHGHYTGSHAAHGPEGTHAPPKVNSDVEEQEHDHQHDHEHGEHSHLDGSASAQIFGIAILEFGVLLHSVLIGLTLAVDEGFKVLFVVIVFHQTFEGLGLGSRLAFIKLPARYNYVPVLAAIIYGLSTPVGIAAGLALRSSYNPGSATASIVSGVLDSLSAGILIYTGLVELLAHEFLFNKEMVNSSNGKLVYAIGAMLLGCGLMALLGKWA
ncbi:ZIP-like iron-zinc transporter [Mycena venus]|uniref:ZIP-like iron-zinc transporter n=1 Tax=Mycena venus TaxID=2733690 RepID=A0A8H6X574_9AGAR|nr:ZIP-like iron-zinc transporter [Mycena venus]